MSRAAVARRRGADTDAGAGASPQYTVDELSAHTGVSSRTIRFYQTENLLPPPLRRGRIALYGALHVERLRLVSRLQASGLRLSAIREALRLDATLRAPWTEDAPRTLSRAELRRVLAKHGSITAAALERVGLLRESGGAHVVPSPALLRITLELDAAGVDLDTAVTAARIVRQRLAPMARELVAHFADRVGRGFGRAATPGDLQRAFDTLRPLGVEAVRIVFGQEVQRAIHRLLSDPVPTT